ncbi:MAG: inverse autotransporter beta domain-containing protein, partial [Planctomycetes bacterium]|nr:inverse autotransporter beta domain-containing protein [Planctomycetota bacterium]
MHNFRWKIILIGLTAFLWNVASIAVQRSVQGAEPWIGFSHMAGNGVGYQNSFSTIQGFIPIPLNDGDSLLFADLNYRLNNIGESGGNVGIGFRHYNNVFNRTFGGYLYFDQSDTPSNEFSQLSVGLETLGEYIDFRTNVYLPSIFNDGPELANKPGRFRDNFFFVPTETAMSGIDMEIGGPVPLIPTSSELKVFGGWYLFDSKRSKKFYGWKARIEARITKTMAMNLSVQHDDEFETTVNFGVLFQFPFSKERGHRKVEDRLTDPVEKLRNVVLLQ